MKAAKRTEILNRRESLTEAECLVLSRRAVERLSSLPEFRAARAVMLYVSFRREVHTHELMRELLAEGKKRVVVPLSNFTKREIYPREIRDFEELETGALGILEPKSCTAPVSAEELDLVVVPCVAFDLCGNRIGYGAGFYDRFLKSLPARTTTIGLAFELQLAGETHCEPHDCAVSKIVTERRVIECAGQG